MVSLYLIYFLTRMIQGLNCLKIIELSPDGEMDYGLLRRNNIAINWKARMKNAAANPPSPNAFPTYTELAARLILAGKFKEFQEYLKLTQEAVKAGKKTRGPLEEMGVLSELMKTLPPLPPPLAGQTQEQYFRALGIDPKDIGIPTTSPPPRPSSKVRTRRPVKVKSPWGRASPGFEEYWQDRHPNRQYRPVTDADDDDDENDDNIPIDNAVDRALYKIARGSANGKRRQSLNHPEVEHEDPYVGAKMLSRDAPPTLAEMVADKISSRLVPRLEANDGSLSPDMRNLVEQSMFKRINAERTAFEAQFPVPGRVPSYGMPMSRASPQQNGVPNWGANGMIPTGPDSPLPVQEIQQNSAMMLRAAPSGLAVGQAPPRIPLQGFSPKGEVNLERTVPHYSNYDENASGQDTPLDARAQGLPPNLRSLTPEQIYKQGMLAGFQAKKGSADKSKKVSADNAKKVFGLVKYREADKTLIMKKAKEKLKNLNITYGPDLRPSIPKGLHGLGLNDSLKIPQQDDFGVPIRWVKPTSNDASQGLARVTDPKTHRNYEVFIDGSIYVPIIDRTEKTTAKPRPTKPRLKGEVDEAVLNKVITSFDVRMADELDWLAYEAILQNVDYPLTCDADGCQSRCKHTPCETKCRGDTCRNGCVGDMCSSSCEGPGCLSMCIGPSCVSQCNGQACEARCRGQNCHARCRSFNCRYAENGYMKGGGGHFEQHYPDIEEPLKLPPQSARDDY